MKFNEVTMYDVGTRQTTGQVIETAINRRPKADFVLTLASKPISHFEANMKSWFTIFFIKMS